MPYVYEEKNSFVKKMSYLCTDFIIVAESLVSARYDVLPFGNLR